MSIAVMNWVWANSLTSGNERLVLLALADVCSRDDGTGCWPSAATIARIANMQASIGGGEPIVETIQQAFESFSSMPVNALGIGRFVVVKSLSPDVGDLPISPTISDLHVEVYAEAGSAPVVVPQTRPHLRVRQIQALADSVVFVRTELPLYGEFLH